ncbi:N-acylneuraminate cytidylyltransferase isoform X2 [Cryptotermes secundus]|uniref:N-acylneuraminate cytidylyltransferase isoform X2 n=1 Tax=Cryptotermes secundus TaxID=105785 RepID=UPI000CD7C50D|nr:N-acylneuraminate cytidylyltransferase isoform X2 [Cryptotermes secundus]
MIRSFSFDCVHRYDYCLDAMLVNYNISHGCSHLNGPEDLHVASLILARGGSKGIRHKNLAKINGTTLLKRSLMVIHDFGRFSSVWVSTDSTDIAEEANTAGAQVHWRSSESATDFAPSIVGVQDFCSFHPEVDVVALIQCTSPFLKAEFLAEAYSKMQDGKYDCVFSVTREYKLRWKKLPDGDVKPINFDPKKRPRRQDWDGELVENGMFYFATANLITYGLLQGGRCGTVDIPKEYSNEIDSPFDLQAAEAQLHAHSFL